MVQFADVEVGNEAELKTSAKASRQLILGATRFLCRGRAGIISQCQVPCLRTT